MYNLGIKKLSYIPMQYINISKITQVAVILTFMFVLSSAKTVGAETYFIDPTGQGCNTSCQQLLTQYFSNSTNTNNSSTSNGSSTSATSTPNASDTYKPVVYPYLQYTNFPSTSQYYAQNANPNYNRTSYQQYPNNFYTYYGKDADQQLAQFQQRSGTNSVGTNTSSYPSSPISNPYATNGYQNQYGVNAYTNPSYTGGFTMTSGF
jgi:hypothetical protein